MALRLSGLLPGWGVSFLGILFCGAGVGVPLFELWRGETEDGPVRPVMVVGPAGTFAMGSEDADAYMDEKPIHQVTLSHSFAISVTEVTQGQYLRVTGDRPSFHQGDDNLPVEVVSWFDAVRYANALSKFEGLTLCYTINGENVDWQPNNRCGYRLPTEAEWEYAARGGRGTKYAGSDNLDEVAWQGDAEPHPVGSKQPNAWGLFDMSGNVWEWVWDWYGGYDKGPKQNPLGPKDGSFRVFRGGSFGYVQRNLRVANRGRNSPAWRDVNLGFRLVRSLP